MNMHSQTHTLTVPAQVQNVQVFVYFPMLTDDDISALVTWDALTASQGGGFVQNYTVQVFQDGQLLSNVSSSACSLSLGYVEGQIVKDKWLWFLSHDTETVYMYIMSLHISCISLHVSHT